MSRDELSASHRWVKQHLGPQNRLLPFAFQFEGRASSEFLPDWPSSLTNRRLDAVRTERTLAWTDPRSGLVVRCVVVEYADYPAVEWTVYLRNAGKSDTPMLEDIQGLNISFQRGREGEFILQGINCQ